ncbi:Crp/Fnr family transcriptional regulator [Pleomorphovibrio marinus]|uniref:Crp/Fnr family transcriptional regulator n=1 Tax=Pleomorphovibrio marinus TaxID=2164132 RepID=UPI00130029EC|nr:Crp/Fnr family transcriptional regulator [Pleomorphovibrio marinus]
MNTSIPTCRNCPNLSCLIQYCDQEAKAFAGENKINYLIPKDQYVFQEGSLVLGAYFIFKGKAKVVSNNLQNRQQTVRLAGDGHILGHMTLDKEFYPIGAVAMEDTKVCFLENKLFFQLISNNPKFAYQVIRFYSKELRKSELRNRSFSQMKTFEKIVFAFLYICSSFGYTEKEKILIDFSRAEIAAIAGTNPEQVSRSISLLKEKGYLESDGQKIIITDMPKLKELLSPYLSWEILE